MSFSTRFIDKKVQIIRLKFLTTTTTTTTIIIIIIIIINDGLFNRSTGWLFPVKEQQEHEQKHNNKNAKKTQKYQRVYLRYFIVVLREREVRIVGLKLLMPTTKIRRTLRNLCVNTLLVLR